MPNIASHAALLIILHTPSRRRSPGRGRYACSPPKAPTYDADRAVAAMSKRYKDLYLPSDFVKVCLAVHRISSV